MSIQVSDLNKKRKMSAQGRRDDICKELMDEFSKGPTRIPALESGFIGLDDQPQKLRPILVVEDNPNDLELTLAALARCGAANEIAVARDGADALDYLRREGRWANREAGAPTVVLLDLKLPKINGLEVLEAIRADSQFREVPVVMLTASVLESDMKQTYALGGNAFVVKPMAIGDFFRAVQDLGVFWGAVRE